MDLCFKNRNLMIVLSEYLTFMEAFSLSNVNQTLRRILQSDEIWWPLYFREYDYRIIDRKAGGAFLAFIYCKKHFSELQSFQCTKKLTLGILGSLNKLVIPDYMAKRQFEFFNIFAKPVIRKRETYEITALSLPNAESLEFEKDYTNCFLICLNTLTEPDITLFQKWVLSFTEQECTHFLIVINDKDKTTDPYSIPEILAMKGRVPIILIKELTEFDINTVLSQILRVTRKRSKGRVQEPPVDLTKPPENLTEEATPQRRSRFRCQLI